MSEIVTVCAEVYVPAAGEKVGVAAVRLMVYVAEPTALLAYPVATAIALIVSVELTVIGAAVLASSWWSAWCRWSCSRLSRRLSHR